MHTSHPQDSEYDMRRAPSRALIFLGWFFYGVALACPALNHGPRVLYGWQCLVATWSCCPLWLTGAPAVFGLTNLLFLFSIPLCWWEGGLERRAYGVFLFVGATASLIALLPLTDEYRVGCYLWLIALFTTATGLLISPTEEKRR